MRFTLRITLVSLLFSLLFWGSSQASVIDDARDYYLELLNWHVDASDIVTNVRRLVLERQREGSSLAIRREDLSPENRSALPALMLEYTATAQRHILDDNMARRVLERASSTRRPKDMTLINMLRASEQRNRFTYDLLSELFDGGIAPDDVGMLQFRIETYQEITRLYQYIYDLQD